MPSTRNVAMQTCPWPFAGKGEEGKGQAQAREVRKEATAAREQQGKAGAAEAPAPDVGAATGLGTQLSSVAGPTLQVGQSLLGYLLLQTLAHLTLAAECGEGLHTCGP